MLSLIVRRIVQAGYAKQNRGDFEALAKMFSADGVFEFQGDTPFGGERRGWREGLHLHRELAEGVRGRAA